MPYTEATNNLLKINETGVLPAGAYDFTIAAFANGGSESLLTEASFNFSLNLQPVPEPSSVVLWSVLGLLGIGGYGWRRRSHVPSGSE